MAQGYYSLSIFFAPNFHEKAKIRQKSKTVTVINGMILLS